MNRKQPCKEGIHKYRRFRLNPGDNPRKKLIFRCILCPHYVVGKEMVIGRESICWVCGKTFRMSEHSLQLKPHCGCKSRKDLTPEKDNLMNLLLSKLGENNAS